MISWVLLCHLNCQRLSHHVSRDSFSERSLFSLALLIHRRPRLHVVRAGRRHHSHHWHHGHFALWGPCLYGYPCNELTSWRKGPAFGNLCACNKPSISLQRMSPLHGTQYPEFPHESLLLAEQEPEQLYNFHVLLAS